MTIQGFDVDSANKPGFSFGSAAGQGFTAGYVKLGGDNIGGGSPYLMTSRGGYHGYAQGMVQAGIPHRGAYWVTGRNDPAGSAQFYLRNLDSGTDFDVLDNESLDDGRIWSPGEAATWFSVLYDAGRRDLWMYASRLGPWAADDYSGLARWGVKALVADYGTAPFGSKVFSIRYPTNLIKGHQWTSSGALGGLQNIDLDVFTDDAFASSSSPAPVGYRDWGKY